MKSSGQIYASAYMMFHTDQGLLHLESVYTHPDFVLLSNMVGRSANRFFSMYGVDMGELISLTANKEVNRNEIHAMDDTVSNSLYRTQNYNSDIKQFSIDL